MTSALDQWLRLEAHLRHQAVAAQHRHAAHAYAAARQRYRVLRAVFLALFMKARP